MSLLGLLPGGSALLWASGCTLAVSLGFGSVQTIRLARLQASTAAQAKAASDAALNRYQAQTLALNAVSASLVAVQEERDAALKATGQKVIQYIRRPAAVVQCLDDDGVQLVAELARGASPAASAPTRALPRRTARAN